MNELSNRQFGQRIGVDDISPPKAAPGPLPAANGRTVDSAAQGQQVRFVLPLDRPPPPQQASEAAQAGVRDDAGPQDVGLIPDQPSAWEAAKPGDGDQRRKAPRTRRADQAAGYEQRNGR